MIDVANAAGVSRTTASFVLNGRDAAIPQETQERVQEVARKMGYMPHASARALATGRTQRIGIVVNEPTTFGTGEVYFSSVLNGAMRGAVGHDYNILLHSAHYPDWQALYFNIVSGATDGVLLIGRFAGDELTPALLESGFPTVCINYHLDHPRCYTVDCDNETGAYEAVRYLLSLGHCQIAFFYPGEGISWGKERFAGARRAMQEAGLPAGNLHIHTWQETASPLSGQWVGSAMEFLQRREPRPTAVLCCEETRIGEIVDRLPAAGVRVPEDLSVISFNSSEISARCRPPMTSVWQPLEEIGVRAIDLLVEIISERESPNRDIRLPMRLDIRQSCAAAPSHTPPLKDATHAIVHRGGNG